MITCGLFYLVWSLHLPMNQAPDEYMRLLVPQFIVNHGALPVGWDAEVVNSMWGTSYAFNVYGSSLAAAPLMALAKALVGTEGAMLHAARLTSVFFAVATLSCVAKIGEELRLAFPVRMLAVCLLAFLPQFAFLASYFNSEQMSFFSTSLCVLFLVRGGMRGWELRYCVGLGISLGFVALSYYYSYGAILASLVAFFGTARSNGTANARPMATRQIIGRALVVLSVALLVAGWFFVRNAILYDGDIFGMSASSALSEQLARSDLKPSARVTPKSVGLAPWEMVFGCFNGLPWLEWTLRSLVGVFGYMSILIGDGIYYAYWSLLFVGLVAGAFRFLRNGITLRKAVVAVTSLLIVLTPLVLSIYYSWASDYQPQGRYLMEGIPITVIAVACGWEGIGAALDFAVSRIKKARHRATNYCTTVRSDADDGSLGLCLRVKLSSALPVLVLVLYVALFVRVTVNVIVPMCMGL